MLFKQYQDLQSFTIDELFKEKSISSSLFVVEKASALTLKPQDFYQRIREVALKRFSYDLPAQQTDLKCLQHPNYKLSLLRDLCIKLGVKIVSY
jgi:hypothetical protein